jgi:ligand-binding sensor domain-containing protein
VALHFSSSGALDSTFGDAGSVLLTGMGAKSALLEPSGDVVVVSGISLYRLSPQGAVLQTLTLPAQGSITAMTRDPASGAIYVGTGTSCHVERVTSALQIDATLDIGWPANDGCTVAALGVDDDGKIVALASIRNGSTTHASVSRYWP